MKKFHKRFIINLCKRGGALNLLVIVAVSISILNSTWHGNWSRKDVTITMNIGNQIVSALEAFKFDNDVYPRELNLLVPQYIPILEPPVVGVELWDYTIHEKGFSLTVYSADKVNGPVLAFGSDRGSWLYDTK